MFAVMLYNQLSVFVYIQEFSYDIIPVSNYFNGDLEHIVY